MRRSALESSPICIGLLKNSALCFIFHTSRAHFYHKNKQLRKNATAVVYASILMQILNE